MPFVGRHDSNYPIYPQFGNDPTRFNNVFSILYESDMFPAGATLNFQLKVADKEIRCYDLAVEFLESEVDFTILEGVTCVDGVTPIPVGNADRNSTVTSSVLAFSDPTAIVGGVALRSFEHFGIPSPVIGLGDQSPLNVDYVTMKLNTNYIFKFVNVGSDTIIDMRFLFLFAE